MTDKENEQIELYKSVSNELKETGKVQEYLNREPAKKEIKIEDIDGKKIKHLPIAILERKLDELTTGLWSTDNFRYSVVANEIVGSLELKYFRFDAGIWITRTGAAAIPIQQIKGSQVNDINKKIKNALVKNMPALKAECTKNAAKSVGRSFGRDLNREVAEEYFEYLGVGEQITELDELKIKARDLLETCKLSESTIIEIEQKIKKANHATLKEIIKYLKTQQK